MWLAPLQWPDWDMFQSGHPWALYHATARAISGGPVYVSDKPGQSDYGLLKRLVAADGMLLRCSLPALPTRDMLFVDPLASARMMKVFNRCGQIGLLGLFHPDADPDSGVLDESVEASEVEGLAEGRFAVHSLTHGFLGVFEHRQPLPVRLLPRQADLLLFSPLVDGFAPLGLVEKLNPAAAIGPAAVAGEHLTLGLRGGGRFALYAEQAVREIRLNDALVPFEQTEGLILFDTHVFPVCRVEVMR